jgi:hypothetical protein
MTAHGLPALYALLAWWFSTGVILYLDGLPPRTFTEKHGRGDGRVGACLWPQGCYPGGGGGDRVGGACLASTAGLLIWGCARDQLLYGHGHRAAPPGVLRRRAAPACATSVTHLMASLYHRDRHRWRRALASG